MLPMIFGGKAYNSVKAVMNVKIVVVLGFLLFVAVFFSTADTWVEILTGFFKFGTVPTTATTAGRGAGDGQHLRLAVGRPRLADIDFSMIAVLGALAAISGNGGLTNTTISAYTRDQGWGMGQNVGAIPSIVGGRKLTLSHTGMVFPITRESIRRFRGWYNVVLRDQLVVWMPACFVGVALPSMLSVQFLPRNTEANEWDAAGMTADGLAAAVGPQWGSLFWHMSLLLRLPGAGPQCDEHRRRRRSPLGRRLLDRRPRDSPLGTAPHSLSVLRRPVRLRGLRPRVADAVGPRRPAQVGRHHLQLRLGFQLLPRAGRQPDSAAARAAARLAHPHRAGPRRRVLPRLSSRLDATAAHHHGLDRR